MPRKKIDSSAAPLFEVAITTAPCVPAIRDKVQQWRDAIRSFRGVILV